MSALPAETAEALARQMPGHVDATPRETDASESESQPTAHSDQPTAHTPQPLQIFSPGQELPAGAILVDGYLVVDPDTGEEIGILAPKPQFAVDTVDAAEWVMERMAIHDANVQALKNRLEALKHNLDVMIKDEARRRKSLELRFGADLAKIAESNLPKGKRTWTCPFGQVAFTTSAPKFKIEDESKALEWALQKAPECVKTEPKFMISLVTKEQKATFIADPKAAEQHGFKIDPPATTWRIETGVA